MDMYVSANRFSTVYNLWVKEQSYNIFILKISLNVDMYVDRTLRNIFNYMSLV